MLPKHIQGPRRWRQQAEHNGVVTNTPAYGGAGLFHPAAAHEERIDQGIRLWQRALVAMQLQQLWDHAKAHHPLQRELGEIGLRRNRLALLLEHWSSSFLLYHPESATMSI